MPVFLLLGHRDTRSVTLMPVFSPSWAIMAQKKDPQPNRLRALKRLIINVLRTEVHDERL